MVLHRKAIRVVWPTWRSESSGDEAIGDRVGRYGTPDCQEGLRKGLQGNDRGILWVPARGVG